MCGGFKNGEVFPQPVVHVRHLSKMKIMNLKMYGRMIRNSLNYIF